MEPDVKINSNMNELKENETTVKGQVSGRWLAAREYRDSVEMRIFIDINEQKISQIFMN